MRIVSASTLLGLSLFVLGGCNGNSLRAATTVLASPTMVDFGPVPVSTTRSIDVTLTVSGPGQVALTATSVVGSSAFTLLPSPSSPVTNQSPAKLTVTFQPTDTGPAQAVLHLTNNSLNTPDLTVQLSGVGVAVAPDAGTPDAGTPDAGTPDAGAPSCSGYTGSPADNIIQVPMTANASTVTVACPDTSVLIGCGFLCDNGTTAGGTEMLDAQTCRADCQNASTVSATAFCYRGDPTCVTRVEVDNVPRGTVVDCPGDHPQVLGCTSRCVNANTQNNNGEAYPTDDGRGCDGNCDYPGDTIPQLVVYCGDFPKMYSQVVQNNVPNDTTVACPDQTTLVGGLGVCVNARAGGFISVPPNEYVGRCNNVDLAVIGAFCLAN